MLMTSDSEPCRSDGKPQILVIAYFFPPDQIGVRRLVANLRTWSEEGLNPVVLTCGFKRGAGFDPAPLSDPLLQELEVHCCGSWDPYRLMEFFRPRFPERPSMRDDCTQKTDTITPNEKQSGAGKKFMTLLRSHLWAPDDRAWWIGSAHRAALKILKEHPSIRAVYTSNYPQSDHIVGLKVKQTLAREGRSIRWLADFRDGWTQNPAFYTPGNPFLRKEISRGERLVCENADEIVTVSPPITEWLQKSRPADFPKVQTITNGFDPADFQPQPKKSESDHKKISIVYTGTFFGRRHPRDFFRLVGKLLKQHPQWKEKLELKFFGELQERDHRFAKKCGIRKLLKVFPQVPFQQSLLEQQNADVLLLILERGPGSEIMVSQKVFEYLASQKPVYALIPDGAAATILEDTGGAFIEKEPRDFEAVLRLNGFLENVQNGTVKLPEPADLKKFHRRDQALALAKLLLP